MFKLGEMFVSFVGKDGGLARTVKLAESMGKNVTKIFQSAMKEGGKIGVQVAKGFERIGVAAARASTQVARSFERMGTAASRAAARIGPAMLRSLDRMTAAAGKVGVATARSFGSMGTAAVKQLGPMANALAKVSSTAIKGGVDLAKMGAQGSKAGSQGGSSMAMLATAVSSVYMACSMAIGQMVSLISRVGQLGVMVLTLASNTQEMNSKFDVVFGKSAPAAKKQIEALSKAMGRSEDSLRGMASQVQDMLVPLGFARDKAAGMSVSIAQLAVDMASFNNISDADAIEDIHAALAGSHEVMKKYGVALNETTLKAEMLKMGFKGSAEEASEQMKALARLNIIIAGTGDAQGDAVRTGNQFANQMKRMMGLLSDGGRIIGNIFMPAAEKIAGFLGEQLQLLKDNSDAVSGWGETLAGYAQVIIDWIGRLSTVFQNWGELSGQVFTVANTIVAAFINNITTMLINLGIIALNAFDSMFKGIIKGHDSLWGFLVHGWGEYWDWLVSGGMDKIDLGLDKVLKQIADDFHSQPLIPLDTAIVEREWAKMMDEIDKRLDTSKKNALSALPPLKAFNPNDVGVSVQRTYKFEMVNASDAFKKGLEDLFEAKKEEDKVKLAQAGLELQKEQITATKEVKTAIDKTKDELTRPVVAA